MKIIFAGTPAIARTVLEKILNSGFSVDLVLTKPDSESGRGKKLVPSMVKQLAIANNIPVLEPTSFKRDPGAIAKIRELKPDIMVVVAYGLILPQELLDVPKLGCVNIHVSLLPRHRGAAPIQRAILAGDEVSGITIIQMNSGLDTGDILLQEEVAINKNDTALDLHDKLAEIGALMIVEYLQNYKAVLPIQQSEIGVTYAHKIDKAEAKIDWNEDSIIISRKIRAFNPAPGAFCHLDGELIKIWRAEAGLALTKTSGVAPGTIMSASKNNLTIACGNNTSLVVHELQQAGKKRVTTEEFLNGHANSNLVGKTFMR